MRTACWVALSALLASFGCGDDDAGACTSDAECTAGRSCVARRCVPAADASAATDAGVRPLDGSTRDGAVVDAGPADGAGPADDAGVDAGCVGDECARAIVSMDGTGAGGVCVLLRSSELWCGDASASPPALALVGTFPSAVAVSRGLDRACLLYESGIVECFRPGEDDPVAVTGLADATHVDIWVQHACAVRAGGEVVCWGDNDFGQIEPGGAARYDAAHAIVGIDDATQVATARVATCALLASGQVSCWGDELGTEPTTVSGIDDAVAVTAGHFHFCALSATGTVTCFGTSRSGLEATTPGAITDATEVVAGHSVTCYRSAGGSVRCWGELMMPGLSVAPALEPVAGVTDATRLANGCALRATGALACWEARDAVVEIAAP